jgi:hypothetical protein
VSALRGLLCEISGPSPRREPLQFAGLGIGQQAQYVAEVCEWVDAGQLAAGDDAEEHCGGMGAPLGPGEQPVLPPDNQLVFILPMWATW